MLARTSSTRSIRTLAMARGSRRTRTRSCGSGCSLSGSPRRAADASGARLAARLQLFLSDVAHVADLGRLPGEERLRDLEELHGAPLMRLEICGLVRLDLDEHESGIVGTAVPIAAFVAEPRLPIRLVQGANEIAIGDDARGAAHRHPLA